MSGLDGICTRAELSDDLVGKGELVAGVGGCEDGGDAASGEGGGYTWSSAAGYSLNGGDRGLLLAEAGDLLVRSVEVPRRVAYRASTRATIAHRATALVYMLI